MATGRMLKRNISESRRLAELKTDSARMLWTWIIPYLDVEGRFHAAPDMIKGKVVPRLKSFNEENIREYLDDMARVDLITLYQHDGDDYLQFRNFKEFQTLQPKKEGKPLPAPEQSKSTPVQLQDNSKSAPTQFNIREVNIREANATPEQLTPVDNSQSKPEIKAEPVPEPPKEKSAFWNNKNKEFSEVMEKIKIKYNPKEQYEIENWIKANYRGKHPDALIHTLNSIVHPVRPAKPDISISLYLDKVIALENQNYNAADYDKQAAEFKKPGLFSMSDIFAGMKLHAGAGG